MAKLRRKFVLEVQYWLLIEDVVDPGVQSLTFKVKTGCMMLICKKLQLDIIKPYLYIHRHT